MLNTTSQPLVQLPSAYICFSSESAEGRAGAAASSGRKPSAAGAASPVGNPDASRRFNARRCMTFCASAILASSTKDNRIVKLSPSNRRPLFVLVFGSEISQMEKGVTRLTPSDQDCPPSENLGELSWAL